MADAADSKSAEVKLVGVRVPPSAPVLSTIPAIRWRESFLLSRVRTLLSGGGSA